MSRASLRCLVLAVVALLSLPGAATAFPFHIPATVPPQLRAAVRARLHAQPVKSASVSRLDLRAQGYAVSVVGFGDVVAVEVTPRRDAAGKEGKSFERSQSITSYVARGTVTPNRIEASFGDFGKVAVRFHPSGQIKTSKPRHHCRGPDRFTSRLGVFVGSIWFTGEDHYVSVRAHRAKGAIRSPVRLRCSSLPFRSLARIDARSVGGEPKFVPTVLSADWRQALTSTDFLAFRFDADTRTLFFAVTEESKGSLAEIRYAFALGSAKTLVSNDALSSASVTPPGPFDGKGTYAAAPDGARTWTGALSASFPGAPRFPLTGPQFKVALQSGF